MRQYAIFLFASVLCGCALQSERPQGGDRADWSLGALTAAECAAKDGIWWGVEGAEYAQCIRKPTDEGKVCREASDCIYECLAEGSPDVGASARGRCSGIPGYGCFQRVSGGRASETRCVDP